MATAAVLTTNGVLPVPASATQKSAPANGTPRGSTNKSDSNLPPLRSKVVLRRLAPGITQGEFEAALGEEWKLGAGKVDWVTFKPGKISKDLSKPSKPSRAYLRLTDQAHLAALSDKVRQTPFQDARNSYRDSALIGPPSLEFAPYSKVPGGRRRNDARQGLIDQDPEFKEFLESLTNPVARPSTTESNAEPSAQEEKVTTTPLIEHLREKKAQKEKEKAAKAAAAKNPPKDDKTTDKKIVTKGKEPATPSDKGKRLSKAEKAVKDAAIRVLSKEAGPSKETASTPAPAPATAEKPPTVPTGPAAEKKRERGNFSAAARILQRDLGIGPAAGRRGRRDATPTTPATRPTPAAEAASTQAEPSTPKSVPSAPASSEKASTPGSSRPPKKDTRPTRAERRAHKASLAERTNNNSPAPAESSTAATKAPIAPTILKKPQPAPSQPSKGSAASKAAQPSQTTTPSHSTSTAEQTPPPQPPTATPPVGGSEGEKGIVSEAGPEAGT
ncbi:hypothetical protein M501DRAFT_400300 [Patellaria atrata CBS 101060]|uniref:UPF3 domain-containing protein n=1 Tax=Patellaria atrata CBS 101060 TaxID=1346257 RepID=A0A9P4SGG0_9PEZI|nr:hypothetical protein M501DRAFT_400300 [Patellaria atrata CBS 101060]